MKKFLTIFTAIASLFVSANLFSQNTVGNKETVPFGSVDKKPMFQGGEASKFSLWVFSQIKYPEDAFKNNITGKVLLQFVISKEGKVTGVKVLRSSGNEMLDNEAIRVISSSPDWEPGKVKGEAVDVIFTYPIIFKLTGENKEDKGDKKDEAIPFSVVEEKPKFQGQDPNPNFTKWVFSYIKYPQEAAKNKIMGRTVLQFVISKEGKVTDVKVLRSSGSELLDNEAVRVISSSPDWEPGKMDGKPVNVKYTFPVVFMLR